LRELIAAVSSWLRRRARRLGIRGALKAGAFAVVRRFNSALDASPHFHTLFLDDFYGFPVGSTPVFHPPPAPRDEDVALVAAAVCRRVERKLSIAPRSRSWSGWCSSERRPTTASTSSEDVDRDDAPARVFSDGAAGSSEIASRESTPRQVTIVTRPRCRGDATQCPRNKCGAFRSLT
jgi:hypothetical protein